MLTEAQGGDEDGVSPLKQVEKRGQVPTKVNPRQNAAAEVPSQKR